MTKYIIGNILIKGTFGKLQLNKVKSKVISHLRL